MKHFLAVSHTINDAPSVLSAANLFTANDNGLLGSHDRKWNDVLHTAISIPEARDLAECFAP